MNIAVPKETVSGEKRVALVPDALPPLTKAGFTVLVEAGAGQGAYFQDTDYEKTGAKIIPDAAKLLADPHLVVKIHRPADREIAMIREGAALISFLYVSGSPELAKRLAERKITAVAMELIPRISRAQSMDALSSQANIAGYKAVLIAAESLHKFFPMLMTAAGMVTAAKVLVLGAGVAGLQAIATARRLGAQVWGYDVRPVVREQVESLGAKFLQFELSGKDLDDKGGYAKELSEQDKVRQQQGVSDQTKEFDVVITTALIPGRPAPPLITKETVARMRPGSVIVDLAAETGGNCELTKADEAVVAHGVTIHGPTNLPSTMSVHASQLYARNITELVKSITKDGKLNLNFDDEILKAACVTHEGQIRIGK